MKITLQDVAKSLEVTSTKKGYNTDLFSSDREYLDTFVVSDYDNVSLIDTDSITDGLKETIVCTSGVDAFLVSVTQRAGFNGETEVTVSSQLLTLAGFNYFTKKLEPFTDYYNLLLDSKGYDFNVDDIKDLGEYNSQYNCTRLKFVNGDFSHSLVVNSLGQLSSIKRLPLGKEVGSASPSKTRSQIRSILG